MDESSAVFSHLRGVMEDYQYMDARVSLIRNELKQDELTPEDLTLFHTEIKKILIKTEGRILELESLSSSEEGDPERIEEQLRLFHTLHKRTTATIHLINERELKMTLNHLTQTSPPLYHLNTYRQMVQEWGLKPFLASSQEQLISVGFVVALILSWCFLKKLGPLLLLFFVKGWLNLLDFSGPFPLVIDLALEVGIAFYITLLLRKSSHKIYRWVTNILLWVTPFLLFIGYAHASLYFFYGWLGSTVIYLLLHRLYQYLALKIHEFLRSPILEYWGKVVIACVLSLLGFLGFLLVWRVNYQPVSDWAYLIFFGIEIGSYQFSLINLFIAIGTFFLLVSLTRYLQKILDHKVFAYTYIDRGISHAIKTAVGYLGLIIAALFALNIVGIKFSNVMYILGGLSVGVGLGLQPIVTNFISGLIMLIERPIRIGDLVDLPEAQGVVTKINVRTTTIRTKDRCTVLVPNNQLINNSLRNWTHENKQKRMDIAVNVACDNDPARVREVLLNTVKGIAKISEKPAPRVDFVEFGASTFDFAVIVYVDHFEDATETSSACRYAIEKAFREQGIKVSYPRMEIFLQKET